MTTTQRTINGIKRKAQEDDAATTDAMTNSYSGSANKKAATESNNNNNKSNNNTPDSASNSLWNMNRLLSWENVAANSLDLTGAFQSWTGQGPVIINGRDDGNEGGTTTTSINERQPPNDPSTPLRAVVPVNNYDHGFMSPGMFGIMPTGICSPAAAAAIEVRAVVAVEPTSIATPLPTEGNDQLQHQQQQSVAPCDFLCTGQDYLDVTLLQDDDDDDDDDNLLLLEQHAVLLQPEDSVLASAERSILTVTTPAAAKPLPIQQGVLASHFMAGLAAAAGERWHINIPEHQQQQQQDDDAKSEMTENGQEPADIISSSPAPAVEIHMEEEEGIDIELATSTSGGGSRSSAPLLLSSPCSLGSLTKSPPAGASSIEQQTSSVQYTKGEFGSPENGDDEASHSEENDEKSEEKGEEKGTLSSYLPSFPTSSLFSDYMMTASYDDLAWDDDKEAEFTDDHDSSSEFVSGSGSRLEVIVTGTISDTDGPSPDTPANLTTDAASPASPAAVSTPTSSQGSPLTDGDMTSFLTMWSSDLETPPVSPAIMRQPDIPTSPLLTTAQSSNTNSNETCSEDDTRNSTLVSRLTRKTGIVSPEKAKKGDSDGTENNNIQACSSIKELLSSSPGERRGYEIDTSLLEVKPKEDATVMVKHDRSYHQQCSRITVFQSFSSEGGRPEDRSESVSQMLKCTSPTILVQVADTISEASDCEDESVIIEETTEEDHEGAAESVSMTAGISVDEPINGDCDGSNSSESNIMHSVSAADSCSDESAIFIEEDADEDGDSPPPPTSTSTSTSTFQPDSADKNESSLLLQPYGIKGFTLTPFAPINLQMQKPKKKEAAVISALIRKVESSYDTQIIAEKTRQQLLRTATAESLGRLPSSSNIEEDSDIPYSQRPLSPGENSLFSNSSSSTASTNSDSGDVQSLQLFQIASDPKLSTLEVEIPATLSQSIEVEHVESPLKRTSPEARMPSIDTKDDVSCGLEETSLVVDIAATLSQSIEVEHVESPLKNVPPEARVPSTDTNCDSVDTYAMDGLLEASESDLTGEGIEEPTSELKPAANETADERHDESSLPDCQIQVDIHVSSSNIEGDLELSSDSNLSISESVCATSNDVEHGGDDNQPGLTLSRGSHETSGSQADSPSLISNLSEDEIESGEADAPETRFRSRRVNLFARLRSILSFRRQAQPMNASLREPLLSLTNGSINNDNEVDEPEVDAENDVDLEQGHGVATQALVAQHPVPTSCCGRVMHKCCRLQTFFYLFGFATIACLFLAAGFIAFIVLEA